MLKSPRWKTLAGLFALSLTMMASAQTPKTELVYWSQWNQSEPEAQVILKAISAFEAANPGVKVSVNWVGRDIRKLVLTALDAGKTIDVFDNDAGWLAESASKYLLPLNKYLSQPALGAVGKTVRQSLSKAVLEQSKVGSNFVSLAYQPYAVLFFYNKDHFQKAGITQEPTTWDALIKASDKLKKAGFEPITTEADAFQDVILGYYLERATGSCAVLQNALVDRTGQAWAGPAFTQMARDIGALASSGYIAKGTAGNRYPAGEQRVALGEVSMYLNGSWMPKEVRDSAGPNFRWGSFSFPTVKGGKGSTRDIMAGTQALAITRSSKLPDVSFSFLRYVVSKDAQTSMVKDAGVPAAHVDVPWTGAIQEAGESLKAARRTFGWGCDIGKGSELGYGVIIPAFGDLLTGKINPTQYLERTVSESTKFWAARK